MAAASRWLWWTLLFANFVTSSQPDQNIIPAESGQNVNLTCQAPNHNIIVVEWSRADLETEYVLLFQDGHFDKYNQHPSFKSRVDLLDRQMKDGDVSLILKDVTSDDTGTYECRVFQRGTNRRKRAVLDTDPICIINLRVAPPGQPGGHTGDEAKEVGIREHFGLLAPPLLLVIIVIIVIVYKFGFSCTKWKRKAHLVHSQQNESDDEAMLTA